MDAPYNRELSRNLTKIPEPRNGEGLAVHALLVDAATGRLAAQKIFSLSTGMTENMMDSVRRQPHIPDYDRKLQGVYQRYTTLQLLEISQDGE